MEQRDRSAIPASTRRKNLKRGGSKKRAFVGRLARLPRILKNYVIEKFGRAIFPKRPPNGKTPAEQTRETELAKS
jgi:hypothetical protein